MDWKLWPGSRHQLLLYINSSITHRDTASTYVYLAGDTPWISMPSRGFERACRRALVGSSRFLVPPVVASGTCPQTRAKVHKH